MKTEREHMRCLFIIVSSASRWWKKIFIEKKKDFFLAFFDVFRCCGLLLLAILHSHFFAVQAGISIVLLSPSLVFIMMVCYFYIFQRFNLQLFFASHTRFTFYKLSLLLSKDMKKRFNILSFISFLGAFLLL